MDPHHQTENLHENDLAEFLRNFNQFWEKYGNTILIVAMVLVLGFAGYRFFSYRYAEQHETAWFELAYETSPAGYREVAQAHDNPAVKALAYLRGGDLLLAKALAPADAQPQPDPAPGEEGEAAEAQPATPQDPAALLEDAADMYQRALEVAPHAVYRINAMLGLAAVAESQKNWDRAEELYRGVVEAAGEYPMLTAQAQKRLELLPDLKTPVAFAPPEAPEAPEAPETPEAPEAPETPEAPEAPETPEASEASETAPEAAAGAEPASRSDSAEGAVAAPAE